MKAVKVKNNLKQKRQKAISYISTKHIEMHSHRNMMKITLPVSRWEMGELVSVPVVDTGFLYDASLILCI